MMSDSIVTSVLGLVWSVQWVAGCVLAKGFVSTTAAIMTGGLWSLYLVVEKIMITQGWM